MKSTLDLVSTFQNGIVTCREKNANVMQFDNDSELRGFLQLLTTGFSSIWRPVKSDHLGSDQKC
jgi:hypothetical protein